MTGQATIASFPRWSLEMKLSPASSRTIRWNFKENLGSTEYYDRASDLAITNTLVHNFLGVRVDDVLTSCGQPGKPVHKMPNLDYDRQSRSEQ